jgi:hypothetical protein
MKPPRTLNCTWEDLTGLEELDSSSMENVRLMLRSMLGYGPGPHQQHLQRFFEVNSEAILHNPTSDLCVVLYRLLEGVCLGTLGEIIAFSGKSMDSPFGFDMSLLQFFVMVEGFFFSRKTPVPVVAGFRPMVCL